MVNKTRKPRVSKRNARKSGSEQLGKEVLLAEYNALREEITNRLSSQQQLINFSIALIASVIAVRQFISGESGQVVLPSFQIAYLFLSIFFSAFGLMYIEHDLMMADMATYINKSLRPKLQSLLDPELSATLHETILGWDDFRGKGHFQASSSTNMMYLVVSASRYALMLIPSIALIVYYFIQLEIVMSMWEVGLVCLSVLLSLFAFLSLFMVRRRYFQIA